MGSFSSLLVFGLVFLLIVNVVPLSYYLNEARLDKGKIPSEILLVNSRCFSRLYLTGFAVEHGHNLTVSRVSFNVTYFGERPVRAAELWYANLITAYARIISGSNGELKIQPTVKRIPYTKILSSDTAWTIDVVYGDNLEPLNKMLESGALNSGETASIRIEFASDDSPCFNPQSAGYFYVLLDFSNGAKGVISIK